MLQRPCPGCGLDTRSFAHEDIPRLSRIIANWDQDQAAVLVDLASAGVPPPEIAVQFVEAGADREQAVTLSLDLGTDVGVGVGRVAVPAVLPLIGRGALRETPGLGDDKAPPPDSAVHEERVPHARNGTSAETLADMIPFRHCPGRGRGLEPLAAGRRRVPVR